MKLIVVISVFLLLNYSQLIIANRQLSFLINEECGDKCNSDKSTSATNLVHVKSVGTNDTIHFLWGTIKGSPPTMIIVQTSNDFHLDISWDKLINGKDISGAINFTKGEIINAIGVEISRIYFFYDTDKVGSLKPQYVNHTIDVDWDKFLWKSVNGSVTNDANSCRAKFAQKSNHFVSNETTYTGTIELEMYMNTGEGRDDQLPHLMYSERNMIFQITVSNVSLNEKDNPRLMTDLTIATLSNEKTKNSAEIETKKSIDDEYTPGVFSILEMSFNSTQHDGSSQNVYTQWNPIGYNKKEKIIANTVDVVNDSLPLANERLNDKNKQLKAFFGPLHYHAFQFHLTFGAADDTKNYYSDTNYTTFSFSTGLGSPPEQKLSFLVQMIILVGFGLPLLVMALSAVYLIVRKIRKKRYDDLLLSRESIEQSR